MIPRQGTSDGLTRRAKRTITGHDIGSIALDLLLYADLEQTQKRSWRHIALLEVTSHVFDRRKRN
ncbi:uncharacterized protein BDZ99DRAFT_10508 [Mytilinidion resinicola]|uniref:Uncharacterized protein n=1 Tax=Mytilinidion resinicola TaxID=574789 RepID=A0A6A6Z8P9_9PEZI|nr:uncharacterized protein BDZ99DRAFT_10508 [Mytilinidion resinicola]KAF2817178.1 hypothetical protein BDZ99DRAFT_10508 [Mytilinidion resinicola]